MSKLQELIWELCPDGVEYKTIQETVGVNRGKRLTKRQLSDDGKYDVYHGSKDSILGKYTDYNAPGNTVIIINTGAFPAPAVTTGKEVCTMKRFAMRMSMRASCLRV